MGLFVDEGLTVQGPRPVALLSDLERRAMADGVEKTLRRGGLGNPDVLLVRTEEGLVVVAPLDPLRVRVRKVKRRLLIAPTLHVCLHLYLPLHLGLYLQLRNCAGPVGAMGLTNQHGTGSHEACG